MSAIARIDLARFVIYTYISSDISKFKKIIFNMNRKTRNEKREQPFLALGSS